MDGDVISKVWPDWKTVRTLGRGGFGCVYEVEREQFGRVEKAAVKTLTIPQDRSVIDEMFSDGYDEASIAGRMDSELQDMVKEYYLMAELRGHTNVVSCDDLKYVKHADGMGYDVFIRMELLTPLVSVVGKNLSAQSAGSMAVKLGKDICRALELCEKKNIVHRDIKPQNILRSEFGDYKLGDFGIARIMEHTTSGTRTGTFEYMSPEVYQGRPYGRAADIYSLGLVLYWLLNERRMPFLPLSPAVPTASMESQARDKRFRGAQLPEPKNGNGALKRVVLRACAYEPEDRFASAGEMLRALELAESGNYAETQGTAGNTAHERPNRAASGPASGSQRTGGISSGTIGGTSGTTGGTSGTIGGRSGTTGGTTGTIGGTSRTAGRTSVAAGRRDAIWNDTDGTLGTGAGKRGGAQKAEYEKTVGVKAEKSPKPAAEAAGNTGEADIRMILAVSAQEAAQGCRKEITIERRDTVGGALVKHKLEISVPAGISSGKTIRLQNVGHMTPSGRGSVYCVINIQETKKKKTQAATVVENPGVLLAVYVAAALIPTAYIIYQENGAGEPVWECALIALGVLVFIMLPALLGWVMVGTILGALPGLFIVYGATGLFGYDLETNSSGIVYFLLILGFDVGAWIARTCAVSMKVKKLQEKRNRQ